jgi:hypothetical protein
VRHPLSGRKAEDCGLQNPALPAMDFCQRASSNNSSNDALETDGMDVVKNQLRAMT